MNLSKGHSVSKLQREINKELSTLQMKRNFSLTSLSCNESLRSSISKSVKSIFIDEDCKKTKKKGSKEKISSPKTVTKQSKIGRSEETMKFRNLKSTAGKLKKKKSEGISKEFTTMSRKDSEPTHVNSILSSFNSFSENEYTKLIEKNVRNLELFERKNEDKIESQKILIEKLESIIEELLN